MSINDDNEVIVRASTAAQADFRSRVSNNVIIDDIT
jgi:hypothetical protein